MATILSGDIDLTLGVTGRFGHHVATTDTTRVHTSESRKPCSIQPIDITGLTVYDQDVPYELALDYNQYGVKFNRYADPDYLIDSHDVIETPNEFNQAIGFAAGTRSVNFVFDFADYIELPGTVNITGTFMNNSANAATVTITGDIPGAVDSDTIPAGTEQDFTLSIAFNSTQLSKGILQVPTSVTINDITGYPNMLGYLSRVEASITVTGRTRINTANVIINGFSEINAPTSGPEVTNDAAVRFSSWDSASTSWPGSPVVHAIMTHVGLLDNVYAGTGGVPPLVGVTQSHSPTNPYDPPVVPYYPEVIIRRSGSDLITDSIQPTSRTMYLGAAPTNYNSGQTPLITGVTDLPLVYDSIILNDGSMHLSDTANIDIEYRWLQPSYSGQPLGYERGFLSARLLLNPPFIAEDIDLKTNFGIAELYYLDTRFTSTFIGGIQQLGESDLESAFQYQADNTGTGVIIDGGAVNTTVNFGINDIYQLDSQFTANFQGNQRHQPTVNIEFSITQSLVASETGVIISNEKTTAFNWSVSAVPLVFVVPDRYRELLLMPDSRVFPAKPETRDYAVNTETRAYPVPEETRQRTVDQETRTQTEKGYT